MYYSVSSAFERSRVNGHVSGACCVWTEDFFDNDCGPFAGGALPISARMEICIRSFFKRFGYGGKERGFYFLTLREFPDAPGTHIYI